MKGRILGFNEGDGSGAITAEDGSRHRFGRDDWRGERPPAAGMSVDFESVDGAARDIYPVAGAGLAALGAINVDLSGATGAAGGEKVKAMFTRSLAAPLALVVLVACFLPALALPTMEASLLGLNRLTSAMSAAAAMTGEGGSGGDWMLILRFVPPVAAAWLAWTAWSGGAERQALLIGGGGSLLGAGVVFMLKQSIVSMAPEMAREAVSAGITYGLGFWLLILAGGALIAAGLGLIRNPLGGTQ